MRPVREAAKFPVVEPGLTAETSLADDQRSAVAQQATATKQLRGAVHF